MPEAHGVSVVVVNWNAGPAVAACLASLAGEACDEVVLVDNGSSDGSIGVARGVLPRLRVVETDLGDVAVVVAAVLRDDDAGWRLEDETALLPRRHQAFLDQHRDCADGAVTAHRQAAAGFDVEYANVIGRVNGRVKNAPAHHVVPAGLEHQAFADPVEFPQKMEPALHHAVALEERPPTCDYAYGVTAGVGVDTEKSFAHRRL